MARTRIDYGIDLGTTNSAIARMENGQSVVKKSDMQMDTTPSCVYIDRKQARIAGMKAFNRLRNAKASGADRSNTYVEFKRTMGTDKQYVSSHLGSNLTSEDLSAEVLKTLKSYIKDEDFSAVVITIPAAFKNNQIDATRRAAQMAGFDHVEMLQEPIAASMAYGLDAKRGDGHWLVFDFGGGTFDSALLSVQDGVMNIIDSEGDNYLGGKNLDEAIMEQLLFPYLEEHYDIGDILADKAKREELRSTLKPYAEDAKIALSSRTEHAILTDLGDIPFSDADGDELELDLTVTQQDLKRIFSPIFQRAVDLTLTLLQRNNLKGSSLASLILVGGPTFSPILREMIAQQICPPDTSVDPMTVVARGAALYASTIEISDEVRSQTMDRSKVQLDVKHEGSSVEMSEFVTIQPLPEKMDGPLPSGLSVEIVRADGGWSTGRIEIKQKGEVFEVKLQEGRSNSFRIELFDGKGSRLECEPSTFSIIQGSKMGSATLTLNWGVEVKDVKTGRLVFKSVEGLEKNKALPAQGIKNGLKTQQDLRPGMRSDFIRIPLYQGEHGADGTRAIYNEHVYDITISGNELPRMLPAGSDVDLTIRIDRSQKVSVEAYFPYLDYTEEIEVPSDNVQSISTEKLRSDIRKGKEMAAALRGEGDSPELREASQTIERIATQLENSPNDTDNKMQVLSELRRALKVLDGLDTANEWPRAEAELREEMDSLQRAQGELGNDTTAKEVARLRGQADEVIRTRDARLANELIEEMRLLYVQLTMLYQLMGFIRHCEENFASIPWADANAARQLINEGKRIMVSNPTEQALHPVARGLFQLMPREDQGDNERSALIG